MLLAYPAVCAFSTTVALFSGSPQHDALTHKIALGLKRTLKDPVEFIGVAGQESKDLFSKLYASSSDLQSNQLEIHRTYIEVYQDAPITVYRSMVHYRNRQVLNKVFKGGFLEDLLKKRVSAVINVGNFSFTKRLNTRLREVINFWNSALRPVEKSGAAFPAVRPDELPAEGRERGFPGLPVLQHPQAAQHIQHVQVPLAANRLRRGLQRLSLPVQILDRRTDS